MLWAVRHGNLGEVSQLISWYGLSHCQSWARGYVLLREAMLLNQREVVKLLLENGAQVNNKSCNPTMTLLHFAAEIGDIEMVEMLVNAEARIDQEDINGRTPLCIAVKSGNSRIANYLLNHGAWIHVRCTSLNHTPLHIAATDGNEELVELLLSNHADVNAKDSKGLTPFHYAVEYEHLQVIEYLLIHGADINSVCTPIHKYSSKQRKGYTPLHIAAEKGNTGIIKLLLTKGSVVNATAENNLTPLHVTIKEKRETAIRVLLEHGADVNAKTLDNQTPLNIAVKNGSLSIIQDILSYKPDPSDEYNRSALRSAVCLCESNNSKKIVEDLLNYGLTFNSYDVGESLLLNHAVKKGYEQIVEDFLKYGTDANYSETDTWRGNSVLHNAAINGHVSIVQLLIGYGADINCRSKTGHTPIYCAIENGLLETTKQLLNNKAHLEDSFDLLRLAIAKKHKEIFQILMNYDIDINTTDRYGRTILHLTVSGEGNEGMLKLLLEKSVNVNAKQNNGETALHTAIRHRHTEMVKLLLEYNADIISTYKGGATPLHLAASIGSQSITTMILNKGANINAELVNGVTALWFASKNGHSEVVEILLKSGAEFNSGVKKAVMVLHTATKKGHRAVVEILLKYGADIDIKDNNGYTALHIAAQEGHVDIVNILLHHGSDINSKTINGLTPFGTASIGMKLFERQRYYSHYSREKVSLSDYYDEYDRYDDHDISPYEIVINSLKRHRVKLSAANLYSNDSYLYSIDTDPESTHFRIDCEEEITNMKSEKISCKISFYDILTNDTNQLAIYSKNENIIQAFTTNEYKIKFPIYACIIDQQIKKGKKRNDLLEQSGRFFHAFSGSLPMLTLCCIDQISSYLSDDDLRNLIKAVDSLRHSSEFM